jgi:hypothetical protein
MFFVDTFIPVATILIQIQSDKVENLWMIQH